LLGNLFDEDDDELNDYFDVGVEGGMKVIAASSHGERKRRGYWKLLLCVF
jgi:hypothetical protein